MSAGWIAPRLFAVSTAVSTTPAQVAAASSRFTAIWQEAFRLRLGDYRVLFTLEDNAMHIFGVRHRSQAYR